MWLHTVKVRKLRNPESVYIKHLLVCLFLAAVGWYKSPVRGVAIRHCVDIYSGNSPSDFSLSCHENKKWPQRNKWDLHRQLLKVSRWWWLSEGFHKHRLTDYYTKDFFWEFQLGVHTNYSGMEWACVIMARISVDSMINDCSDLDVGTLTLIDVTLPLTLSTHFTHEHELCAWITVSCFFSLSLPLLSLLN